MHASGTERDYIEDAIRGGIEILGFSDHTPQPYPDGYRSNVKMRMDQLEDYVDTLLALKREYAREIEIHIGLEVEYYPEMFGTLTRFTSDYPIEYYLLGQHCLGNEIGDVSCFEPTRNPEDLVRYTDQVLEGLGTGKFSCLAHPDVFFFTGDRDVYEREAGRLCEGAKALDIPLEINLLGIWRHRHYPNELFWKAAGETGNRVVIGADAHRPDKVWNPSAFSEALALAERYHLEVAETMEFIDPSR